MRLVWLGREEGEASAALSLTPSHRSGVSALAQGHCAGAAGSPAGPWWASSLLLDLGRCT